ncbi:Spartin [Oryzias melastigma]|uniref:Spartin n=1 Tax=Oryzias melastigma TaxID=30732 RepID=A0A834F5T5_ORYME|nr:Spartin [Oryzias melastigma]
MAEPAELLLIRGQYELALQALSCGLAAEDSNQRPEALDYFRKGHLHLIQGLEIPTGGESHLGAAWDTARELQHKMRDTLRIVKDHLSALENSRSTSEDQRSSQMNVYPDLAATSWPSQSSVHHLYPSIPATTQSTTPAPLTTPLSPATEQTGTLPAAAPTDGHCSLGYGPAGPVRSVNQNGKGAPAAGDEHELLCISSGVQLFFVDPSGEVSSLLCPGYLRIITFESQHKDSASGKPSSFLHVCDRMYPLTTDTPVLLANSGIFMFPDTMAEVPGAYVGIVLSSELPAADHEIFQDLLSQLADLKVQDPEETGVDIINLSTKVPIDPLSKQTRLTVSADEEEKLQLPGWSEKMAQGILSGASRLSQSLTKGAEATGSLIHKGAAKIRDRITPEETPSEVSPQVAKRLQAAKQATGGAVRVSQFLVNGLSNLAEHVADKVSPHVKKHGSKLVPESLKKSQDGRASNWDGTKFVAASGLHGFSTVWTSLENGAKKVCKGVATETVTTVKYKYGHNTGHATDTALQSVANIGMTAYNIDNLGLKAFLSSVSEKSANTVLNVKDIQPVETEEKGMLKAELRGQKEMERREQCAKGKDMEKQTSQTEPDPKNLQSKNKEEKK